MKRRGRTRRAPDRRCLRQVAEHLIVGAVFLDDVEDVLDRRSLAAARRDRLGPAPVLVVVSVVVTIVVVAPIVAFWRQAAVVATHLLGQAVELVAPGHVEN